MVVDCEHLGMHGKRDDARERLEQIVTRDGLDEVIGRAAARIPFPLVHHRHDDHGHVRDVGIRLRPRKELPAVDSREEDVEHDSRRAEQPRQLQPLLPLRATATFRPASPR